jgi:eukaryotic-like serine/threonine-protein kinase
VSDDSLSTRCNDSALEFLGNLERSGILTDSGLHEIKDLLVSESGLKDSSAFAEWLVEQGRLTEFQARRLLVGKTTGLVFGRYILLDRLGNGSMGRVLKARHRLMDRVVALKVISPTYASSLNSVSRFLREMKIVGMLDHPNVVRAFDADQQDNSPYIVMEYLEGEDLEKVLRQRGMLPPDEVVEYMAQAAWGLAHAHEKGVIHRDIKPTNLFLTTTGAVKVLDLGLGAFVGLPNEAVKALDTDEGFVVGTTDYMSPEQISGQPVDARTDLFSLGCSMYRLLTGKYAFPGMTKIDRLARRLSETHVPINEVRSNLPAPLIAVLDRMLCLKPEDRFSSAVEVAEALEPMIPGWKRQERGASTGRTGKPTRIASSAAALEPETPLDWTMIESALQKKRERTPQTAPTLSRTGAGGSPTSTASLQTHRKRLEAEGDESGRSVQREYRKKVIELNRELAEERKEDSREEMPSLTETWLERLGEQIGDFLADPSAGHLFMVLGVVALVVALSLVYALQ